MADNELLLRIGVSADTRSLSNINKEFNALGKATKGLNSQLKNTGASLDAYKQKQQNLTRQLELCNTKQEKYKKTLADIKQKMEDNRRQVEELKNSEGDHSSEIEKLDAQYEKLVGQFNTTNATLQQTQTQFNSLNRELQETTACVENFGRLQLSEKFKGWSDSLKGFSEKAKLIGDSLSSIGSAGLKIFTPLDTALVGSAKSFMEFEKGIAKVNSIAKVSNGDLKAYSDGILELSNNSGTAVNDLTEATYQAISAGVDYKDSTKFVEDANKLAVAGFTDTTSAVDLLTTIMNAYGLSAEEVTGISDTLIESQNLGKLTINDLAQNMGNIIPIAKSMGVSYDEVAGSLVMLTKQGISTAEGSTMLERLFDELGDSGSKVAEIIKNKTGKSFQELQAEGANTGDVLKILQEYSKESGVGLNEMFSSSEALQGALGLLNTDVGTLGDTMNELSSSTGATNEAFDTVTNTSAYKMQKAFNELKNSLIKVGEALTPFVEKFADGLSKVADALSNLSEEQIQSIAKFALWGTAVSGVLKIAGGFCSSLSSIAEVGSKAFNWISKALDPTRNLTTQVATLGTSASGATSGLSSIGTAASGATSLISPLTLGLGACVTAIAALGVAWYHNEQKIKKGTESLRESAGEVEDFTGKLRTNESIWTELFGKEYSIKFSDSYKQSLAQVESDVEAWVERLKLANKNINEILNNTEIDEETKQEQIKAILDPISEEVDTQTQNIQNNLQQNSSNLHDYLVNTLGMSEESANQIVNTFGVGLQDSNLKLSNNLIEMQQIIQGIEDGTITDVDSAMQRLQELTQENCELEKDTVVRSGEDIYQEIQKQQLELQTLKKMDSATNLKELNDGYTAELEVIQDAYDKKRKAIEDDMTLSDEQKEKEIANLNDQQIAAQQYADYYHDFRAMQKSADKDWMEQNNLTTDIIVANEGYIKEVSDKSSGYVVAAKASCIEALKEYAEENVLTTDTIVDEYGHQIDVAKDASGNIVAYVYDEIDAYQKYAGDVANYMQDYCKAVDNGSMTTDEAMAQVQAALDSGVISAQQFGFETDEEFLRCARSALDAKGDVDKMQISVNDLHGKEITVTATVSGQEKLKTTKEVLDGLRSKTVNVEFTTSGTHKLPSTYFKPAFGSAQGTHGNLGQDTLVSMNESELGWELYKGSANYLGTIREANGRTRELMDIGRGGSVIPATTSYQNMLKAVKSEVTNQLNDVYFDYANSASKASKLAFNFGNPQQVINNSQNYDDSDLKSMLATLLGALIDKDTNTNIYLNPKELAKATYKYSDKFMARDAKRRY